MKLFKEYLFTSIVTGIVAGLLLPVLASGDNALVSKAMIQLGWCRAYDSVCLIFRYLVATIPLLFVAIVVDVSINLVKRTIEKPKTSPQPKPTDVKEIIEKPQALNWVAVVYDEVHNMDNVTHWAAIRINNQLNCHKLQAKLDRVIYTGVDLWADDAPPDGSAVTREFDVDWINPTGDQLVWNPEGNTCILHVVRESRDDKGAVFVFNNWRTSIPLPSGQYELEISITGKAIKDVKIVKTLSVTELDSSLYRRQRYSTGLAWMK